MALQIPDSMDELVYWTNRTIGNGKVMMWVYKEYCPNCKKAKMTKPVDEKGNVKSRAKEYLCSACGYSIDKKMYEESLTANIIYTCPACQYKGECTGLFKRKNINGILTFRFQCEKCKTHLDVTKKMKEKKAKEAKKEANDVLEDE